MEKQEKQKVEARNISMYEQQWDIVDHYGRSLGLATSTALRVIVEQWRLFHANGVRAVPSPQDKA